LPPTASEVDRFVADRSPRAYEDLVDRTLSSPRFGEHWARHWLDLVRYAETRGYEWNYEIVGAWRYRDYLIRALNADVPYDQLIREHLAGDLIAKPRINAKEGTNESVIGTAFYRLGEAGHDDCTTFREIALDVVDNQIDTVTKAFQGVTVSCARCHNHKLDPIPTEDYYGLYSILNSSRVVTHTIDLPDVNAARLARLRSLKHEIRGELARLWKKESRTIAAQMLEATQLNSGPTTHKTERLEKWKMAVAAAGQNLADPAYPFADLLCKTASQERWLPAVAVRLAERYRQEQAKRTASNRDNFQQFSVKDWRASGNGLHSGSDAADFEVSLSGETVLAGVLPPGIYTHALSSRLNGALRSPYLPKNKKYLSVRVLGGGLAARRTVIDNCAIGENYKVLENDRPQWVRLDTLAAQAELPVFVELVTRWDNPRLPDRPDVLKPHQAELLTSPRSYFGITDAVLHDTPELPAETLLHMLPLFGGEPITDWQTLARRYEAVIAAAVERWASGTTTDDDARWLDWLVRNGLLANRTDATNQLSELIGQYRSIESEIPEPRVIEGLADVGDGKDFAVLIGGNPKNLGKPARRQFLSRVLKDALVSTHGSGRRELAEVIANPTNPLTSRVMANRIWSHVFGRGIVASVDNFGLLGDRPSHPELLDYLGTEFVKQGWSMKKLIRSLVMSETFQQSGEVTPRAREIDPENRLLHHYPLRRLEAESIRDSILLSSGKLSKEMYGPSLDPHRDQEKAYRRLFSGPLDGNGRRSLYLKVTRMEGTRFLDMFDYPSPMATRGSRDVTNVPAQALTLLNDPFVVSEAEACARRLLSLDASSVEQRIDALFRLVLSRSPNSAERERFRGLAAEVASLYGIPKGEIVSSLQVWKDLTHAAFNVKEFIYLQ
jgi:hypothetical protein